MLDLGEQMSWVLGVLRTEGHKAATHQDFLRLTVSRRFVDTSKATSNSQSFTADPGMIMVQERKRGEFRVYGCSGASNGAQRPL